MLILTLPFLLFYFLTGKIGFIYAVGVTLIPTLLGGLVGGITDTFKELGADKGFKEGANKVIFWITMVFGTITIYLIMKG